MCGNGQVCVIFTFTHFLTHFTLCLRDSCPNWIDLEKLLIIFNSFFLSFFKWKRKFGTNMLIFDQHHHSLSSIRSLYFFLDFNVYFMEMVNFLLRLDFYMFLVNFGHVLETFTRLFLFPELHFKCKIWFYIFLWISVAIFHVFKLLLSLSKSYNWQSWSFQYLSK